MSVTFQLNSFHRIQPTFKEGEQIEYAHIKDKKIKGIITKVLSGESSYTLSVVTRYVPKPKSRVKNGKSIFSKIKYKILEQNLKL